MVHYIGDLGHVAAHNTIDTLIAGKVDTTALDSAVAGYVGTTGTSATKTALNTIYQNYFTPQMFGAKGDGVTDDTAAVQAAFTAALTSSDPANGEKPPYTGTNGTVFMPLGTYSVNEIQVPGTVAVIGAGGGTYATSTFLQRTVGGNIIRLKADTDGLSNSTLFTNVAFKSVSGSSAAGAAQVITDTAISSNSIYFRNCWFKSPETYAIWLTQGDDIQVTGCTFDVAAFHSIRLGNGSTGKITNATISNNTFYNVAVNAIVLENVHGVSIANNRAYTGASPTTTSVFVNSAGASALESVTITGNEIDGLAGFVILQTPNITTTITGNTLTRISAYVLKLNGTGIFYNLTVVGNVATSVAAFTSAPFTGPGCGLQQAVIAHNSVVAGATTALMFDMSDARVTGNLLNLNVSLRFSLNNNFAVPANNGA